MIGNGVGGLTGADMGGLTGARLGGSMGAKMGGLTDSRVWLTGVGVGAPGKPMVTLA